MENKTIYKVGDVVYCHFSDKGCVKGMVTLINPSKSIYNKFPIKVAFKDIEACFTKDGRSLTTYLPTLSFAPYDFINGGFTQERPLLKIEIDTLVYVRYQPNEEWKMRYFSHFENNEMYVFRCQSKSSPTELFRIVSEWSLINPLE